MRSQALTDAVEAVYRALDAPPPETLDYCTHCLSAEETEPFTTVPLRELTAAQVHRYWHNDSTVGDDAFRGYLLPRLLELVAQGALTEWVANYFLKVAWRFRELPEVRDYLEMLFRYRLRHPLRDQDDLEIRHLIEHLGDFHDDLGPFLAEVEQVPDELLDLVEDWFVSADWDDRVKAWLSGPGPLAALARAASGPDPDGRFAKAHQNLYWSYHSTGSEVSDRTTMPGM